MRVRTASIVAAALATLWLCMAPNAARAGTYVVHACSVDGTPAPLDGWVPTAAGVIDKGFAVRGPFDECASGAGFGVDLSGATDTAGTGSWLLTAPAGTSVDGVHVNGLAYISPFEFGTPPPFARWPRAGGSDGVSLLAEGSNLVDGLDVPWISLDFECTPCAQQNRTGWTRIGAVDVTLHDEAAPAVVGTPSPLGPFSGAERLGIPFRDSGSGVQSVELLVDGRSAGVTRLGDAGCVRPFVRVVPCPTEGTADVPLDARGLADGTHQVSAVLTDASGNATTAGPYAIVIDHSVAAAGAAPDTVLPQPAAVVRGTLKAGFGRQLVKRLTVAYSAPPVIRGTLVDPTGKPLAGASVQWSERTAVPGATFTGRPPVTTDRLGRFHVRLSRGTSRTIRLAYGSSTASIGLTVRAPVRLTVNRRVTRNGRQIRFRGTVRGAEGARTYVDLQAWAGSWITFRTASLKAGRFHATYRFTRTFATTRYRFRAVVHSDPTLPYASAASPVATVLVQP